MVLLISQQSSLLLGSQTVYPIVHLIPSLLVLVEINCTLWVVLPKQPINQSKPVEQGSQQALRAYCPNLYTVFKQERTREYLKLEEDLENQIVEARKISVQAKIQEELKRLKEQVSTYI